MKKYLTNFGFPALVGLMLVLPFLVLEYVNTRGFTTLGFPVALFVFMWLLVFGFVLLLMPTVRDVRSGIGITAHPAGFILRSVLMIGIAVALVGIVQDQMPCFMGVPNCD